MLTLAGGGQQGYSFEGKRRMGYGHDTDFTLRVSPFFLGTATGFSDGGVTPDYPRFTENRFGPDIIERTVEYSASGLRVQESCLRTLDAQYLWRSVWQRDAYRSHAPHWTKGESVPLQIHLMLELRERSNVRWKRLSSGTIILSILNAQELGTDVHLAIHSDNEAHIGVVAGDEACLKRARQSDSAAKPEVFLTTGGGIPFGEDTVAETDSVILAVSWDFGRETSHGLCIAWSPHSEKDAAEMLEPARRVALAKSVEADWDQFFSDQPECSELIVTPTLEEQLVGNASKRPAEHYLNHEGKPCVQSVAAIAPTPEEVTAADCQRAYDKCLALTRCCERVDPVWGVSLTETFTCYYSGTFAWSFPVAGWYFRQKKDPKLRAATRAIVDCYRRNQATDGSLPCSVAFAQKPPPTPPESHSHTQIPQYAWGVWQEFSYNQDVDWLASWYEPLRRYAELMQKRDRQYLNLGLWCQTHHYDGIDIFPTVDGLAIRKEPVLYSAVFAAEQIRYYEAMALISRATSQAGGPDWMEMHAAALRAMHEKLWDAERQWFGDILASGQRETVVGIVGLYAAAYGLLPADHDAKQVRTNLESLIVPFGVATVAPSDRRYCERFFWRGPVWPASCLYGAGAALRYAPDLLPRIAAATVRFALAQPNIYECLEAHSGQVARYDEGNCVMPGLSSVVGSYAICSALDICSGKDLFYLE